ncbi:hypothetical protein BGZ89_006267 [Linnemannia elongata]|nr:hypothetical protein BGZ89_006267 [Linnemannia elongata]
MLDEFLIEKDEGFPDHPPLSVTYMLEYQKQHNGAYNNQIAEFVADGKNLLRLWIEFEDWRKNRAKLFWLAINVSVSKVAMEEAPEWTNLAMDQALRRPELRRRFSMRTMTLIAESVPPKAIVAESRTKEPSFVT